MMKLIIYMLCGLCLCFLCSCNQQDIPTYDDLGSERYIYLYKMERDSTETSFLFYPNQQEIRFPVSVRGTGAGIKDEVFKLAVVEEYTTAPSETYSLPENPVFRAGRAIDTCYITLKYHPRMDTEKLRLVIELQATEDFLPGQEENRVAIIWFHNIIMKPAWWRNTVQNYYLGTYSDKKYKLFLEVVGVDLASATDSEVRTYALIFKKYLIDKKKAGETVFEADGTEMTLPVSGNI